MRSAAITPMDVNAAPKLSEPAYPLSGHTLSGLQGLTRGFTQESWLGQG